MEKFKPADNSQLFLLPPNIEDFIPASHLARVISEVVETIDVAGLAVKYGRLGQKSYHPRLILKLLFYGYSIGMRSGRKIAAACEQDTAFMYLASMYKPDFRTINDFRKNNTGFVQKSFVQVIRICQSLGMGRAGMLIVDGTKVRANANGARTKGKEQYSRWLDRIDNEVSGILREADCADHEEDARFGDKRGDGIPEELLLKQRLKDKITEAMTKLNDYDTKINLTDPDAKYIKGTGGINLNYNCQTAITEDGLIVAAYASNNPSDKVQIINALQQAEGNTSRSFDDVLADSGYSSYDVYDQLKSAGKNIYIPDQEIHLDEKRKSNPYYCSHFTYNKETNTYTCPENKTLVFDRLANDASKNRKGVTYACRDCGLCDKKSLCTKGKYRTLEVEQREYIRDEVRALLKSPAGERKYMKRRRIESIFGHLKANLKYINLTLRELKKVTTEWQLICIGYNLKKLHQFKLA